MSGHAWLGGLCARALLGRVRAGLRAARSPLLTPASAAAGGGEEPGYKLERFVQQLVGASEDLDGGTGALCTSACALEPGLGGGDDGGVDGEARLRAAETAAALPAAVQVCDALRVLVDEKLRASVEWQLAGHRAAAPGAGGLTAVAVAGLGAPIAARPSAGAAPEPRQTEAAARGKLEVLADYEEGLTSLVAVWRRHALGSMPHWSTVVSCAMVMVVGTLVV